MSEDYQTLMTPLIMRLGGDAEQFMTDEVVSVERQNLSASLITAEPAFQHPMVAALHRAAQDKLEEELLANIYVQSHCFFEKLIIDLLLAMGYANRRRDLTQHIGRSHDGGVDGIIQQDELGLDLILLQAKRLKPGSTVTGPQVRDFVGSLATRHASKGILVTTADFTASARQTALSVAHRVVLINGRQLAALMVRHNMGVKAAESFVFKAIDRTYFNGASGHKMPASRQPVT